MKTAGGERIEPPGPGRVFRARRRVRLSDVDPAGAVRLDAVARYLQDVATDDVREAGVEEAVAWVVRRTTIVVSRRPVFGEPLELATWCSGTGPALAERRTSITGSEGAGIEAVALWVSLDRRTHRPAPLADEHFEPYREQAAGRRVRSRFVLGAEPPPGGAGVTRRAWALRDSDFDLMAHLNNVVAWTAAEEEARRARTGQGPVWGQVEYRRAVGTGESPVLVTRVSGDGVEVWLLGADGSVAVAARFGY